MPTFAEIKQDCTKSGALWEDPDFPATDDSIIGDASDQDGFIWKRPTVLVNNIFLYIVSINLGAEMINCYHLLHIARFLNIV